MHTDENKKFDKRNVKGHLKNGVLNQKEYESYLLKLPDVQDKCFNPEEGLDDLKETESSAEIKPLSKKRELKKKIKGKGK
jgi:hypothetical protein